MAKEICVVVSSRKSGSECDEFITMLKETCGTPAKFVFVTNDGLMGLSELYGSMLENTSIDSDIMIFMHDDVVPLRHGWGKEVVRLFNKHREYGIIGVAGSSEFNNECAWWRNKRIYGQVLHKNEKTGQSWLTAFSPLLDKDLQEVCVIDGLFMAINRKKVSKNFDESLNYFDFYDIDFCLANYLDGKCKIGVTTNLRFMHKSIGELSENWFTNREIIRKKYGKHFPISVETKEEKIESNDIGRTKKTDTSNPADV